MLSWVGLASKDACFLDADSTLMRRRSAPAAQGAECCRPGSASQFWRALARCQQRTWQWRWRGRSRKRCARRAPAVAPRPAAYGRRAGSGHKVLPGASLKFSPSAHELVNEQDYDDGAQKNQAPIGNLKACNRCIPTEPFHGFPSRHSLPAGLRPAGSRLAVISRIARRAPKYWWGPHKIPLANSARI